MRNRVHITGASGSGVTTLGHALADIYALPHHDTDDFFWLPTDPPYRAKRDIPDRIRLMREMFLARPGWVLSGSLVGWAKEIEIYFDLVVFVSTPTDVRLERLRRREEVRYGTGATSAGGSHYDATKAFFDWAASYDEPAFEGRSRVGHEAWLQLLTCPVIRVDGQQQTRDLVDFIVSQRSRLSPG